MHAPGLRVMCPLDTDEDSDSDDESAVARLKRAGVVVIDHPGPQRKLKRARKIRAY